MSDPTEVPVAQSRQREREVERQRRERQAQRREAARRRARRRNQIVASVIAVALVLSVVALLATAGRKKAKPSASTSPTPTASTPKPVAFPPVPPGADPRLKTKPVATLPKTAPTKLAIRDLILGKGPAAKAGQQVTVNYVGVGYPDGKEFDSSWKARQAFPFPLGAGKVIKGWDRGIVGMKVGGRRQLTIPAALAYGPQGRPPTIKPNEPLVFVVDLLALT